MREKAAVLREPLDHTAGPTLSKGERRGREVGADILESSGREILQGQGSPRAKSTCQGSPPLPRNWSA